MKKNNKNNKIRSKKGRFKKYIREKRKKSTWVLIACVPAVLVAAVFLFCLAYVISGNYAGLGKSMPLEASEYSSKNIYYEKKYPVYSDEKFCSVPGIDVSVFQGEIDWEKVKNSGIKFAMIKIGYSGSDTGRIFKDANYRKNLDGAKSVGIKVGVYFFSQATTTGEAVEEAKYVIRNIRGKDIEYPVAFDMEHVENSRIKNLTARQRTEITDAFCGVIKKNGFAPMVYGNPSWLTNSLEMTYLTAYDTWLAHYAKWPGYAYKYKMWQFTEKGRIPGISKRVDINLMFTPKRQARQ